MTAILISRVKDTASNTDTIYLIADKRVTSDDKIMSDYNEKIFTFQANEVRPHVRHYVTVGDVAPSDYILHKLEEVVELDDLYKFVMESDWFVKMPHDAGIYMITEKEGMPEIIAIEKSKEYTGTRLVDLDELILAPIYDGSGGLYVKVALDALEDLQGVHSYMEQGALFQEREWFGAEELDYLDLVQMAFSAAAKSVTSMNDKLSTRIINIPSPEVIKTKKKSKKKKGV